MHPECHGDPWTLIVNTDLPGTDAGIPQALIAVVNTAADAG